MSKTDSIHTNRLMFSFGKEKQQNDSLMDNMNDDNYDTFNDETFGEIDSSNDWELEHQKMNDLAFYDKNKDYLDIDDDIVVKSISTLGLEEDDELDDPAIMTFGRSGKRLSSVSRSSPSQASLVSQPPQQRSPPPPAIINYEQYSASPKTQSIWSPNITNIDTPINTNINSVKVLKLQDIENDLIYKNSDYILSTIKRPIKMEDLEAKLLDSSSQNHLLNRNDPQSVSCEPQNQIKDNSGWSPFGSSDILPHFGTNGKNYHQNCDKNLDNSHSDESISRSLQSNYYNQYKEEVKREYRDCQPNLITTTNQECDSALKPLIKAQTLDEIECHLISNNLKTMPLSQQKNGANLYESVSPTTKTPLLSTGSPLIKANQKSNNLPLNQLRPQIQYTTRYPNLYNRNPLLPLVPAIHPSLGHALFSSVIPGSQTLYHPFHRRPIMHPMLRHQLYIDQQRELLRFQHNLSYQPPKNRNSTHYGHNDDNDDEYAGLMTQRDKEWLIKIQQIQMELNDPYVDDYYYVTYISRKIVSRAVTDKKEKPSLLLPERPKQTIETQTSNYIPIQFEGSLGKIQVSNVNCPRKLLDCGVRKSTNIQETSPNICTENYFDFKTTSKSEVSKFRKLLLQIEKLYIVLLNIDDEDKRIGALPEEARKSHVETRIQLCDKLFDGLTNESNNKINIEIVHIKKGLALLFRSLNYLYDDNQRAIIISDLLNSANYRQYILKPKYRLDYGQMLVNAIDNILNYDSLYKIITGINDVSVIIKSEYGQRILETLAKHFDRIESSSEHDMSKWYATAIWSEVAKFKTNLNNSDK